MTDCLPADLLAVGLSSKFDSTDKRKLPGMITK